MPKLFDEHTNKQGLIVYGGESSSDYGMVVAEAPAYERPRRKQTIYNVPGRNGSIIFQQDAWEDVNRSYKVWLAEDVNDSLVEKVDAFEAWLNSQKGYVRLEDNFEPDVYRLAYYSGGDGFSNSLTQYGEATLNFTCRPERFLKSGDTPITINFQSSTGATFTLNNPTKYMSKPLLTFRLDVSGLNNPQFSIRTASDQVLYYEFPVHESGMVPVYFTIDSEALSAYNVTDGSPCDNRFFRGTFPYIAPGQYVARITMQSGDSSMITSATIIPRYFTI